MNVVHHAARGPGLYTFVRDLLDPDCGEIEVCEITVSVYPDGESGIVGLIGGGEILAAPRDIILYLRSMASTASGTVSCLWLNIYDDDPDFEHNRVWLCAEKSSGERLAEFSLEVCDRLILQNESESSSASIFVCGLPSLRSVFRFVSIACVFFQCEDVRVRSLPLSSESGDWFS